MNPIRSFYIGFLFLIVLALPLGLRAQEAQATPTPASTENAGLAPAPTPVLAASATPSPVTAESVTSTPTPKAVSNIRSGFSVGLGWPYVGLKYFFNEEFGAELRYATGDNINLYAGRGYWSFLRGGNFSLQAGAEAGYITFTSKTADGRFAVDGDGFEVSPFAGAEYFIDPHLSLLLDLSMPIIEVQSQHTSLGDLEWVVNSGLYFYPF